LTTKLIVHLTQPAMAVARVWKSPVVGCLLGVATPNILPLCNLT